MPAQTFDPLAALPANADLVANYVFDGTNWVPETQAGGGGGGGSSVSVSNFPATQAVTGTVQVGNFPATQPVSGTVAISTMPTTAVTGTFWQATQPVSGTFWQATQPVSIASMPTTAVTGTFFQATQPVSIATAPALVAGSAVIGKVSIDQTTPGTTNLAAITPVPEAIFTGAITAAQPVATTPVVGGTVVMNVQKIAMLVIAYQMSGSMGTGVNCSFEMSVDSTNGSDGSWYAVQGVRSTGNISVESTTALQTGNVVQGWKISTNGMKYFRVRATAYNTGTQNWVFSPGVLATDPIPFGFSTVALGASSQNIGNVAGTAAAGATITNNPVRLGGTARTANPAAVTDGQCSNVLTDKMGRLVVVGSHVRDLVGIQTTTITASTSEATIVTAIASTFCDLTSLSITNSSATATSCTLKDATAGTTRAVYDIAANGSIVLTFTPPLPQAVVNTAWTITSSASITSLHVNAVFVKNI